MYVSETAKGGGFGSDPFHGHWRFLRKSLILQWYCQQDVAEAICFPYIPPESLSFIRA